MSDGSAARAWTSDELVAIAPLPTGEMLHMRALASGDAVLLGDYLSGLSGQTRSFWGPHRFDHATANAICAGLANDPVLRLVGSLEGEGGALAAYFLLHLGVRESDGKRYAALGIPLHPSTDASLAPSVADRCQNRGVGGVMMAHTAAVARRLGRERIVLWDGVQARNARGIRFYRRSGFEKVGEFATDIPNHDMILRLFR